MIRGILCSALIVKATWSLVLAPPALGHDFAVFIDDSPPLSVIEPSKPIAWYTTPPDAPPILDPNFELLPASPPKNLSHWLANKVIAEEYQPYDFNFRDTMWFKESAPRSWYCVHPTSSTEITTEEMVPSVQDVASDESANNPVSDEVNNPVDVADSVASSFSVELVETDPIAVTCPYEADCPYEMEVAKDAEAEQSQEHVVVVEPSAELTSESLESIDLDAIFDPRVEPSFLASSQEQDGALTDSHVRWLERVSCEISAWYYDHVQQPIRRGAAKAGEFYEIAIRSQDAAIDWLENEVARMDEERARQQELLASLSIPTMEQIALEYEHLSNQIDRTASVWGAVGKLILPSSSRLVEVVNSTRKPLYVALKFYLDKRESEVAQLSSVEVNHQGNWNWARPLTDAAHVVSRNVLEKATALVASAQNGIQSIKTNVDRIAKLESQRIISLWIPKSRELAVEPAVVEYESPEMFRPQSSDTIADANENANGESYREVSPTPETASLQDGTTR